MTLPVTIEELREENKRLLTAIEFWALATYPENRPSPFDMDGRVAMQAAKDQAETTLYQIFLKHRR